MAEAGTGRSKGCGLVVFANAAAAAHAIASLHDSELKGALRLPNPFTVVPFPKRLLSLLPW